MLFKVLESDGSGSVAQADEEIGRTETIGGNGGNLFDYVFGNYIKKITTYTKESNDGNYLSAIKIKYDDEVEFTVGNADKRNLAEKELDLASDNITAMCIQVVENEKIFPSGEHKGIGAIYIKTIRGKEFYSAGNNIPSNLEPVKAEDLPIRNFFLVGLSGRAANAVDNLSFYFQKDVLRSRVIEEFVYTLDDGPIEPEPINVASASVCNLTNVEQEASIGFSESITSTFTWTAETGIAVGTEVTISSGIPFIANGEVSLSLEISFSYSWGEERSLCREFNYQANISVSANTTITASAKASTYKISGSYTAKLVENWAHAGGIKKDIRGQISGLSAYNVEVDYDSIKKDISGEISGLSAYNVEVDYKEKQRV